MKIRNARGATERSATSQEDASAPPPPARLSRKRGRKFWVPADLDEVEKLASHGLTYDQIAAKLGIGSSTLYKKKRELIEFTEAIKKGKASGIGRVANKLFDMAMEGNVTAAIFLLKARAGWRDQGPVIEIHNEHNVRVAPDPLTLAADHNLIREAILILRRLGAPDVMDLDEADFRALPEPKKPE